MAPIDKRKASAEKKTLEPLSHSGTSLQRHRSAEANPFASVPEESFPPPQRNRTSSGTTLKTPGRVIRPDNSWQKHSSQRSSASYTPPSSTTRSPSFKVWHRRDSLAKLESTGPILPQEFNPDSLPDFLKKFNSRQWSKPRTPLFTDPFHASPTSLKMDRLRPVSVAMTAHYREAVRLAEEQQRAVTEKCKRSRQPEPDYTFDELIGKGSFGRVYKGRQKSSNKVVAIKVLDIDEADFHAFGESKDEQIRDFQREIRILRQAQESGAENLNHLIEALPVHSQLWMICEHCPGGSVKTLMRATKDRLQEDKYLVVVARELAKALKGLHEAGIIHRDVKAANVLIHERGYLQLCDFGVANILETSTDKRKTFIGTLHWMAPEAWSENPEYSDEVDVWGYGCTLYECAVGRPPNSDLREHQKLKVRMRRLKESIGLPKDQNFSEGLRALVSSTLTPDVASRPDMAKVLQHDYLKDTEETHPTSVLSELVLTYYRWANLGGQRVSLFMPGGAAAASTENLDADLESADEWNFSMTEDFERRASAILEIPDFSNETMEGEETPRGPSKPSASSPPMTAAQKANFEARVQRGADLSNLFDPNKPAYEYKTKTDFIPIPEQSRRISDLPFRAMAEDRPSSIASNVIDLGDFDESDYAVVPAPKTDDNIQTTYAATPRREETIRLADAATLREKRANSKGPREPINQSGQSLTARRTSSAEEIPSTTATFDFATSQEEWTVKNRSKAPELQEPAEITSSRPGHATMDWSFASAMSEASIPQINEPEPSMGAKTPSRDDVSAITAESEHKARKHATMEWSFSSAMAEANNTTSSDDYYGSSDTNNINNNINIDINSSPPIAPRSASSQAGTAALPLPTSRATPTRAPLMRQMTMPVTYGDFAQAEEQEIPRPSTALSEAYSDVSASSTDIDPFGLEREDDEDDHPGPETLDEDVEMGRHYHFRGRSMYSDRGGGGGDPKVTPAAATRTITTTAAAAATTGPVSPTASAGVTTPMTANGPGFGGVGRRRSSGGGSGASGASGASPSSPGLMTAGGGGRPVIDVPPASPPGLGAMQAGAPTDRIEAELTRLLEGMQGTLNAAREVVGGLEKKARQVESEWEDED
ncbi:hypothetical protein H2204_004359 [Knufia peltigerae]|uniref:non-specific serine/threonine protein kinase n=1 Tax=Knufia peltigerae TaxID=1002370 RepID=A0AA38Y7R0_9EURO|nr:hypothetical protein H2204_004359 [Knufia peltigerae]